jgi:alpha-1,3-mannosyltransferase
MSSPSLRILQQCLCIPQALLINPKYFWYLAALVILADALLTGFIIQFVPCQSLRVYLLVNAID